MSLKTSLYVLLYRNSYTKIVRKSEYFQFLPTPLSLINSLLMAKYPSLNNRSMSADVHRPSI